MVERIDGIYIISDSVVANQKIDEVLRAKMPNLEYNTRYKMGKIDGYERFYKTRKVRKINQDYYIIKCGRGFKHRLKKMHESGVIQFDKISSEINHKGASFNNNDILNYIKFFSQSSSVINSEFSKIPSLPFRPYRHQLVATANMLRNTEHLSKLSTGAGKSLIIYMISRFFDLHHMKILIVVPTIMLTTQLYNDFMDYNCGENFLENVQLIGGENKSSSLQKNIVISTWQSLSKLPQSELIQYDGIIVDEAHTAKAQTLQEILNTPFLYKLGCTGSVPIIETDMMRIEQVFGEPKDYANARDLIDMGLLTQTSIVGVILHHHRTLPVSSAIPDSTVLRANLKYHDEVAYLMNSIERTNFIISFLKNLSKTGVSAGLYHRTEYGVKIYEKMTGIDLSEKKSKPSHRNDFETMKRNNVFFIDGKTSPKIREKIRQYLNNYHYTNFNTLATTHTKDSTSNTKTTKFEQPVLIAQSKVLSTGINIKQLKNIVMLQNNKSFTDVIQILGRVMRLHESKKHVYIFDLVDKFPYKRESYSYQHFEFRVLYYNYERHNYTEKHFDLRNY